MGQASSLTASVSGRNTVWQKPFIYFCKLKRNKPGSWQEEWGKLRQHSRDGGRENGRWGLDGTCLLGVCAGGGHVGRTPFKLGEKVKPLAALWPLLPIISEGTETRRGAPAVCGSVHVVCVWQDSVTTCFKERIYVCVCARICVCRSVFGVCGVGGTVPGEYWGLGGHVDRGSVVWLGWRVRIHLGGWGGWWVLRMEAVMKGWWRHK